MKRAIVILGGGVLLLLAASAHAQRGRISAEVKDSAGNPVAGAVVVAENPDHVPSTLERTTDEEGRFRLGGLSGGEWKITIQADGFLPFETVIPLGMNDNLRPELVLERATGEALLATSSEAQGEIEEATRKFNEGDHEGAIELFRALLAKAPEVHQIHFNLAMAYEKKDELEKAVEHYEKFLENDPDFFEAQFALANALNRLGRHEEAAAHYRKCTELQPENASAHFNLGLALFSADALDESVTAFERAFSLDPAMADALFMLGNVHLRRQDFEAAKKSYEKFLELAPDSPNAESVRKALQELRSVTPSGS